MIEQLLKIAYTGLGILLGIVVVACAAYLGYWAARHLIKGDEHKRTS